MRSKLVVPLVLGMARAWKRSARNSLRLVFGRAARARRRRSVRAHGMPQMLHTYLALCDACVPSCGTFWLPRLTSVGPRERDPGEDVPPPVPAKHAVRVCRSSERCASCYETAGLSEILSGPYNVKLLNARAGDMYLWHMYEHYETASVTCKCEQTCMQT